MSRRKTGIIAGLAFGTIDIIPMFMMDIPDCHLAITGAIITGVHGPIFGFGIIGEMVIGILINRKIY